MEILRNAELWVAVGLVLFFALLVHFKVPTAATAALDQRGVKIKAALDEAEHLRDEARALLEGLKRRRVEAEADAKRMLAEVEAATAQMEAEAKVRLEAQIVRRTELADRRIAAAEARAAADVKAAAAELAVEAVRAILSTRLAAQAIDPLVDAAMPGLSTRLQ